MIFAKALAKCGWLLAFVLTVSTNAAVLNPHVDSRNAKRQIPSVTSIDDRFTPHEGPVVWYALGDSYTAGPGAGNDYDADEDCERNNGSYAVQTEEDFPFKVSNNMTLIACSGAEASDTLGAVETFVQPNRADFMTMTLGGNDIGFREIVAECLLKPGIFPGDCDQTLSEARQLLAAPKFENDIHAVYDKIFERMKDDRHYQLYHIFYHRFFNAETEWCDNETFSILYPELKRSLRREMNALVDDLNRRLEEIALNYIRRQSKASWSQGPRLFGINPDKLRRSNGETYGLFDGHRFCEPGVTDLNDPSVWFFGTHAEDSVVKRQEALEELLGLSELFHPRTAGFTAEKAMLREILQKNRPAEA